jgi:hypothetical protein
VLVFHQVSSSPRSVLEDLGLLWAKIPFYSVLGKLSSHRYLRRNFYVDDLLRALEHFSEFLLTHPPRPLA